MPHAAAPSTRRHILLQTLGLLALPAAADTPPGRVVAVGGPGNPGLAQALRQARAGDTLELQADVEGEVGVIEQDGITLRGAGGRRLWLAGGQAAEGKALLVVRAQQVSVQDIEFRGARVPSGNGAGIRFESGSLELRRCAFFDNENGLLAANRADMALRIHDCEFGDAPRHMGLLHHLLYVGQIGRFELSGSRFANGWRGHLVKSRAHHNLIRYNRMVDGAGGAASYELEMPNGGSALVLGNLIAQSLETDNPAIVSIGAEAQPGQRQTAVVLAHNTLVNLGPAAGRFVQFWSERLGPEASLVARNNVFAGPGSMVPEGPADGGGNLRVALADLVDAAGGDFHLRPEAATRAARVAGAAGEDPAAEFLWPAGVRRLSAAPRLAGALQPGR